MENISGVKKTILGLQMLFVAFGALVLVPLLTGLDPAIALFTAGAGTLLFQVVTKGKVPVFLASSFAFIAPIQYGMQNFGVAKTLGGLTCSGVVYIIFSILVKKGGIRVIERIMPPIVIGPVIMVIGLNLAPVAVGMTKHFGDGQFDMHAVILACITLGTAIIVVTYGKKILSLIPILCAVLVGYIAALLTGHVDFQPIRDAAWFSIPWIEAAKNGSFAFPQFDLEAIIFILPVAIAPTIEHVGGILAIGSTTGRDYIKDPGLSRTLLGDGLATSLASFLGGPPNTTYAEVTGAVALTKAFDPVYMRIAAIFAILLAFLGKLSAVLKTIPVPVMGGIMFLLFGMIAAIGINTLVRSKVDVSKARNIIISSVILVCGIGGVVLSLGKITLGGIGLAGIVGVFLNLILPENDA